jgi:cell division septation protein DedD
MADDSTFRSTHPGNPYGRANRPARPSDDVTGADPLAELARLIGKNDPYAEFGLRDPHPEQQEESESAADYGRDDRYVERHDDGYVERHYASPHPRDQQPQYDERSRHSAEYYERNQDLEKNQHLPPAHALRAEQGASDQYEYPDSRVESGATQDGFAHPQAYDEHDGHGADQNADDPQNFDEGGDQMYDDPPRARRHGGLATALALIGCAVLGTAGAYAYRSYYGPPAAAQSPPVITADTSTPTKIVPAPTGDPQAGKFIQDRVANAGREQVVSKQEEPVAVKDLGTQSAPRVVLPAPVAPAPATAAPQQSASSAVPGSNEPKKVHTLSIRPDGADVSGKPVAAPGSPTRGSGPLSLDPQAAPAPVAPAPRTRTATAPAPSASDSPAATASSGGFLVQLSSQKTEAEASASFRSLQAKFPNELGGRRPVIRRADLGSKGVFYRTMVGPFASGQEANEFCANYKAAGGHCVVPTH